MAADRTLERYAWLSFAAAVVTIALKTCAWYVTDSVGLLSDALESAVNLAGALVLFVTLAIAGGGHVSLALRVLDELERRRMDVAYRRALRLRPRLVRARPLVPRSDYDFAVGPPTVECFSLVRLSCWWSWWS